MSARLLGTYRLLGRTGLRVSPHALGAAMFGVDHPAGSDDATSRALFHQYLETGGNVVDTADLYGGGRSEELVGAMVEEAGVRDRLVLATKFTMATEPGNVNSGGNGRKNMLASLHRSLRRLRTDYVDIYWMHAWDGRTPVEEVMSTFDALVRAGKVRAVGLSNVPAWYAAKAQLLARSHGWEPVAALEMEYSLVSRQVELEHVPAANDLGMALVPWSPLANGFLTGKYARDTDGLVGSGRLEHAPSGSGAPGGEERHWRVLDALREVAVELGRTPAQVALAWVLGRPGVVTTLIGARTPEQLAGNLAAFEVDLDADQVAKLDAASAPEPVTPYLMFTGETHQLTMSAGATITG